MTAKNAAQAAQAAAQKDFDEYLEWMNAGAAFNVPDSTIEAAEAAYKAAGGKRKIEVVGVGNNTHPVISVRVKEISVQ